MKKRTNISIIIYYIVLLIILSLKTSVGDAPPMAMRLAYVGAVILPCILTKNVSYPAIITLFLTIGHYGFAYSYMPYMTYMNGILTLLMTIYVLYRYRNFKARVPIFLVAFTCYVCLVDLVTGIGSHNAHFPENVNWCFLMLLCFFYFTASKYKVTYNQLGISFVVTTLVLSIFFLVYGNDFAHDYGQDTGLERSGWTDPNYFGMVIGMGALVGVNKILSYEWKSFKLIERFPYIMAIIIASPTLLLNASRGAILSLVAAVIVMLYYSRVKFSYKVLVTIFASAGIIWLYQNQYFELLEYRIQEDDGTGSDRTVIWYQKLELFSQGNPLQWLFGHGYAGGFYISGRALGFHNDFIAFLVDYGIIGLGFFVYMLFYPIKVLSNNSKQRPLVIAVVIYLLTCCITLEPFTLAQFVFFAFYFYALIAARLDSKTMTN